MKRKRKRSENQTAFLTKEMKIVIFNPTKTEDKDLCEKLRKYSLQNSREIRIFYIRDPRKLLVKTDYFDCAFLYSGDNSQQFLKLIEDFEIGHSGCPVILFSETCESIQNTLYLRPYRYLTTPLEYPLLREALDSFYSDYHCCDNVIITCSRSAYRVSIRKIMYIEAQKKCCDIVSNDETITVNKLLKEIEAQLPGVTFFRPHRSFYVNLEYVESYNRQNVFLKDGTVLPLSKYRYRDMICAYETYLRCNHI